MNSATDMAAAAVAFGGLAEPVFEVAATLGRFGMSEAPECLLLFAAAVPPPQHAALQEANLPKPFIQEHHDFAPPSGVYAYAMPGAKLWGHGLVTQDHLFVAPDDCLPAYLRGQMAKQPHGLDAAFAGTLGRKELSTLAADLPVVSALHPNLHYTRFLLEMFPRLFVASVLRAYGVAFRLALPARMPAWLVEFVGLFGLDDVALSYDAQREHIAAPSIILPSMLHRDYNFHPALNLAVAQVIARAGGPADGAPTHVFLKRSAYAGRRIDNEEAVADAMAQLGFVVVAPHSMPVAERLRLLAGAKMVAGEYGPALHDTMFCPPGTRILALNFGDNSLSRVARVRRQTVGFVAPSDGVFRHWRNRAAASTYSVDLDALRARVREVAPELR